MGLGYAKNNDNIAIKIMMTRHNLTVSWLSKSRVRVMTMVNHYET